MPRIVSLLPSATEIVSALGFQNALVGRSHECDFPAGVAALPVCTEPKLNPQGTSGEIHRRVEELLRDSLAVYRVFSDVLQELQPTHVVTQTQCDVCAVSLEDVHAALAEWTDHRPQLIALNPVALDDVYADIRRVAAGLDAPERGAALVESMQARFSAITERAATADARPRVACIEWLKPLMAAGNWIPEMVEMAGGENLLGERGVYSPWLTWKELTEADPDLILLFPCGFDKDKTRGELPDLAARTQWQQLRAVREGRVFIADGNQYFNRPGPRLVETLEIMAEVMHPELFDFGHAGAGWERAA